MKIDSRDFRVHPGDKVALDEVDEAVEGYVDQIAERIVEFRVKNEDEAVALANDSDFGLGGSVFTGDVARGGPR